jgi:hypothetical protein
MFISDLGPAGRNILGILTDDTSLLSSAYSIEEPAPAVTHTIDYQSEVVDYVNHQKDPRLSVYDPVPSSKEFSCHI